jgi:hypothetical protein
VRSGRCHRLRNPTHGLAHGPELSFSANESDVVAVGLCDQLSGLVAVKPQPHDDPVSCHFFYFRGSDEPFVDAKLDNPACEDAPIRNGLGHGAFTGRLHEGAQGWFGHLTAHG